MRSSGGLGVRALALGLVLVVVPAARVLACSCMQPALPTAALADATYVFSGCVTAIEDAYAGTIIRSSMDPLTVSFAVDRVWKGNVTAVFRVRTVSSGASCGYEFTKDETYLVYASGWGVSLCSRTSRLSNASVDLAALGAGNAPASGEGSARPDPTPTPDAAAEQPKGYDRCPADTKEVSEPFDGFLDMSRLLGTHDFVCHGCTISRCDVDPRHGPFVIRYADGRTHMRGFYWNGRRQGSWASWHPNGKRHHRGDWNRDRKTGHWQLWRESGDPEGDVGYIDDVEHGRSRWWNENGKLRIDGTYDYGRRIGRWRVWDENGNLLADGPGGAAP